MSDLPSACMIHEHSSPVFGALYDRSLTINYSQMIQAKAFDVVTLG